MKKMFLISLFSLIIGIILSTKVYKANSFIKKTISKGETFFFIQEGIYSSEKIMQENTANIKVKLIEKQDNKYYVFLGITKEEENA